MKTKNKKQWRWVCHGQDLQRGCFSADYEGRCSAHSRRGFAKRENAELAAQKHASL